MEGGCLRVERHRQIENVRKSGAVKIQSSFCSIVRIVYHCQRLGSKHDRHNGNLK